tara:strand:- start:1695 stop:1898 length:204 start_codon:yes stop_codon:yes gene_type:complete
MSIELPDRLGIGGTSTISKTCQNKIIFGGYRAREFNRKKFDSIRASKKNTKVFLTGFREQGIGSKLQ